MFVLSYSDPELRLNQEQLELGIGRMSIADRLAEHVVGMDYESLPADAVAATKRFILDTLGVAWAGSGAPGGEAVRALIAEEDGREESSVWAFGGRTTATSAAFQIGRDHV